jgi:glutaredoxin
VIIFSKSYCPHSRRAKGILLDKYVIDPVPVVVELDKHPMGSRLQGQLEIMTGRRTVPNVLIDGISIGGGDDVAALDNSHALIEKVRLLAGHLALGARMYNREREICQVILGVGMAGQHLNGRSRTQQRTGNEMTDQTAF